MSPQHHANRYGDFIARSRGGKRLDIRIVSHQRTPKISRIFMIIAAGSSHVDLLAVTR